MYIAKIIGAAKRQILLLSWFVGLMQFSIVVYPDEARRTPGHTELELIDYQRVVEDEMDLIPENDDVFRVGKYKVLSEGAPELQTLNMALQLDLKPIRLASTGQIVLTRGHLIVELREIKSSPSVARDHALIQIGELKNLSRVVLQQPVLASLQRSLELLRDDPRVLSVDLDTYSGGGVAQ